MKVSVKKLKDLERKITISVPVEDYESKFNSKIKNIKTKAKIDGFRKGNVPMMFWNKDMDNQFMLMLLMS